jgi:hypothetical protein
MTPVRISINSETKNHAIPNVRIANGSVTSLSSGFRRVFRTPNTAAAASNDPAFATRTPLRTAVMIASTTAFVSHEIASLARKGGERLLLEEPR